MPISIIVGKGIALKRKGKKYATIIATNNAMMNPFDLKVPVLHFALPVSADIPAMKNLFHGILSPVSLSS